MDPEMGPTPFAAGTASAAHPHMSDPAACFVVSPVSPSGLSNAVACILNAPGPAAVRLGHFEGRLCVSVRQRRGETLGAMGRLSEGDVREMLRGVLSDLAAAHSRHTAHLDVKADNIVRHVAGDWGLIDWGSALHAELNRHACYSPGAVTTPEVRAPWMAEGRDGVPVDAAKADVWAAGATALCALAGWAVTRRPNAAAADDPGTRASFMRELLSGRRRLLTLAPSLCAALPLLDLLSKMLSAAPEEVPSAAEALASPVFSRKRRRPDA